MPVYNVVIKTTSYATFAAIIGWCCAAVCMWVAEVFLASYIVLSMVNVINCQWMKMLKGENWNTVAMMKIVYLIWMKNFVIYHLTILLTALSGNLRWMLLPWLPSVARSPDDGCFNQQLQYKCCLIFPFPAVWSTDSFPRSFWGNFIWETFFGRLSWFPTLKAISLCGLC